jgi:4-diphosphocytidyl-2-C-methyl-D-erythritol kinase
MYFCNTILVEKMIGFANAKINLGLNVLYKRADGFHELESVFYPVNIFDSLEILDADELKFSVYGIEIPGDANDNLCIKAFNLLKAEFNISNVHIHLLKNIPFGAGLGGGSSDAALTLKMLNQKFDLNLSDAQLETYAAQLGSDCAFFIKNSAQLATGRGEILKPIDLDLNKKSFLLIKPNFGISTKEAYANIRTNDKNESNEQIVLDRVEDWQGRLKNDFEEALFPKYPVLAEIKNQLYEQSAIYAAMSGSGSTMFGIFENENAAQKARAFFENSDYQLFIA